MPDAEVSPDAPEPRTGLAPGAAALITKAERPRPKLLLQVLSVW
jgi:hypothetical protein